MRAMYAAENEASINEALIELAQNLGEELANDVEEDFTMGKDVNEAISFLNKAIQSGDTRMMVGYINSALNSLTSDAPLFPAAIDNIPGVNPKAPGYSPAKIVVINASGQEEEIEEVLAAGSMKEYGWQGPIIFEGKATGDNRFFKSGAIQWDMESLPWPFRWQKASVKGHEGAVPIGRLDSIDRQEDGSIFGRGVIIPELNEEAAEYLRLLESGVASGVSVDGDSAQFDVIEGEEGKHPRIEFSSMRLRSLTAVDIPAFDGARIALIEDPEELARKKRKEKMRWAYSNEQRHQPLVASAIPVKPKVDWFLDPNLDGPAPVRVSKEGAVYGHLALFDTCHIGFKGSCVTPPRNSTYKYFHTGEVETDTGECVDVGHLTFNTGHAAMSSSAADAASHYDNTGTVAADVRVGEDKYGIWVAGAMRPTLSDEEIRCFRAAPLSGDWRRIAGRLELVGALAVNVPGFPVPRAKAMVASGNTETLFTFSEETLTDEEVQLRLEKKVELASNLRELMRENISELVDPRQELPDVPERLPTKKDVEEIAKNYTPDQVYEDLELIRGLLDDPDETIPKGARKQMEAMYSVFIETKGEKKFAANGVDLNAYFESDLTFEQFTEYEASGLDLEEFYNTCHGPDGKFCPTPGGRGSRSGSSRGGASSLIGKAYSGPGGGGGGRRGGGGGGRRGGGGGGRRGGGPKGPPGGNVVDRLTKNMTRHASDNRKAVKSAKAWAAVSAISLAMSQNLAGVGSLLTPVAKALLPPFLANPVAMTVLTGIGLMNLHRSIKRARTAKNDHKRTVTQLNKVQNYQNQINSITRQINKPFP